MPSLSLDLRPQGQLTKRLLKACQDRVQFSKAQFQGKHKKWIESEKRAVAYLPERETDAARRVEREQGGLPQYTTIQIPYSYAVLMASHTYWTTVFLGRTPVLQFEGRHGETEQQTMAVEAQMGYQTNVGGHLVPYFIWLLDVGKYGMGVIGNYWQDEIIQVADVVEVEESILGIVKTGKTKKKKITRRVKGYSGNKLYNIRPYEFYPDPRVPVYRFQEGEFCAVYVELGWNEILRRADAGYYVNLDQLKKGDTGGLGERAQGSEVLDIPNADDTGYLAPDAANDKKVGEVIKLYEVHIDLVPKHWGLGSSEYPEKWVFTCTADYSALLGAQPLGALHNKFPFQVIEFEPEGYGLTTRGIPEILEPVQNTMDWLINSHFYNVRAALNNQFIVDPSRVMLKDMLDPNPGGVWRLKPAAYGSDARMAVHQVDIKDITRSHLTDIQVMLDMGQRIVGVNDQILGMLNTKGRRSATEVRSSTTFGVNRLKSAAEFMSAMGFSPLAQMMLQNTQQYYTGEQKFKIVGDLANDAGPKFVNVSEETLAGFYDFVPVDGTLPVDRYAQATLWKELLIGLRQMPEIAARYDIPGIFAWVAKLGGLKNINQFRVEVKPDAMLQSQAQQGNVVPLGGGSPTSNIGRLE